MNRKPYAKPVLRRVELAVEEAVLAACKTQRWQPARGRKWCVHPWCKRRLGS